MKSCFFPTLLVILSYFLFFHFTFFASWLLAWNAMAWHWRFLGDSFLFPFSLQYFFLCCRSPVPPRINILLFFCIQSCTNRTTSQPAFFLWNIPKKGKINIRKGSQKPVPGSACALLVFSPEEYCAFFAELFGNHFFLRLLLFLCCCKKPGVLLCATTMKVVDRCNVWRIKIFIYFFRGIP